METISMPAHPAPVPRVGRRRYVDRALLGLLILAIVAGPPAVGRALPCCTSTRPAARPADRRRGDAVPLPQCHRRRTAVEAAPEKASPGPGGAVATKVAVAATPAAAVAAAVAVGTERGMRVGVAVRDRRTGATYVGGVPDGTLLPPPRW